MTPAHLTLLLLVPAFVAGMYLQFRIHARHYRRRVNSLASLPRTVAAGPHHPAPAALAPTRPIQPLPGLSDAFSLRVHITDPCATEIDPPLWTIEYQLRGTTIHTAYVHTDTEADAIRVFRNQLGIDTFKIQRTRQAA